jgi:hypothetical protein
VLSWVTSVAVFRDEAIGEGVYAGVFLLQQTTPSYSDRQTTYTRKQRTHRMVQSGAETYQTSYTNG